MAEKIEFTDNYNDLSTDNGFQFEFVCERCGTGYRTPFKAFAIGAVSQALNLAGDLLGGVLDRAAEVTEEVRSARWERAHDQAFLEAAEQVKGSFVQCPKCTEWVCREQCWNAARGLCKECAPELGVEMAAAQASKTADMAWEKANDADHSKKAVARLARGAWIALALLAALSACDLLPTGGDGSGAEGGRATPTPTPTVMPGGQGPATPEPEGEGLKMAFTLEGATGMATLNASLHSCSGVRGPWSGELSLQMSAPEAYQCQASGTMEFTLPADSLRVEGEVPLQMSCELAMEGCVVDAVSEVLSYRIVFSPGGDSAEITLGSSGGGTLDFTCYEDDGSSMSFHFPVWATFWGENRLTVPVEPFDGCP